MKISLSNLPLLAIRFILSIMILVTIGHGFNKVGTTAAPFLKIEFGARAVAMGGSFVALANDPSGVYYNPAGIAELQNAYISGGHTEWFTDLNYEYAAFVLPMKRINFCLWGTFLSSADMEVTTVEVPEGTGQYFKYIDGLLAFTTSALLSDRLSIGFSAKYIQQSLYNESAATLALDIGSILRTPLTGTRLGMCLVNYGGRMQLAGNDLIVEADPWPEYQGNSEVEARLSTESFPLPMAFKLGLAFQIIDHEDAFITHDNYQLKIAVDGIHPNDGEEKLQVGVEYGIYDILFLRGGYKVNYDTQKFTAGAGVKAGIAGRDIYLDYAYVDMDILDATHRMTLTIGF
ncbi:MAG: PorV/PorQ family protein [bacterium]